MENLIEELTKVNPANLSEEGLKLFNKINEIIDRNEELEKIKQDKLSKYLYENQWICKDLAENYIPKSKARKMLEKLDKEEKQELKGVKGQDRYFIKQMYQAKRSVIKELLQEGDK